MKTIKVRITQAHAGMWYSTMLQTEKDVLDTDTIYYKLYENPKKIIFKSDAVLIE